MNVLWAGMKGVWCSITSLPPTLHKMWKMNAHTAATSPLLLAALTLTISLLFLLTLPLFHAIDFATREANPGRKLTRREKAALLRGPWKIMTESARSGDPNDVGIDPHVHSFLWAARSEDGASISGLPGPGEWTRSSIDAAVGTKEGLEALVDSVRLHFGHTPWSWLVTGVSPDADAFTFGPDIYFNFRDPPRSHVDAETLRHEFTHSLQSLSAGDGILPVFLASYLAENLYNILSSLPSIDLERAYVTISYEKQAYLLESMTPSTWKAS